MLTVLVVVLVGAACSVVASCALWWTSHRSGLWNLVAGVVLGLAVFLGAILIGYLMMRATYPR